MIYGMTDGIRLWGNSPSYKSSPALLNDGDNILPMDEDVCKWSGL